MTSLMTLSGCIASNLVGVNDTVFYLDLTKKQNGQSTYIVKSTSQLSGKCSTNQEGQAYFFWASGCSFGKNIPQSVDIKYAKWKPFNQIPDNYQVAMNTYAQSLPASAWQTYTVYPKQVVAQIKSGKNAKGVPLLPSAIAEKKIVLSLVIDENGNITMEDKYGYSTETYDIR